MPIDYVDLGRLIFGIILLIVPGYLWSFIFFKDLTRLERVVFGFTLSISYVIICMFALDFILNVPITFTKTWILFLIYSVSIIIIYILSLIKMEAPKDYFKKIKTLIQQKKLINNPKTLKYLILIGILFFAAYMGLLPHLKDNYFLPFHVDEWIHWTRTKSMMETGFTSFVNPWLGTGMDRSLEPGFNYLIGSITWLTGVSFNTMFVFMPSIIALFTALAAFNLGNAHKPNRFGLEAAICASVIPTTCRMLGPSFFVPVGLGLFSLVFLLWFLQHRKQMVMLLILPIGLWAIFLLHPITALAAIIITLFYAVMNIFEKNRTESVVLALFALTPVVASFALASRWKITIQEALDAFLGGKYFSAYDLPQIWVSFGEMTIILWAASIIGVYFAFSKGSKLIRTIGLSAVAFIGFIGLYDKFGYGLPIMYERSFMYLFLMIGLLGGYGISQGSLVIKKFIEKDNTNRTKRKLRIKIRSPLNLNINILKKYVLPAYFIIIFFSMIGSSIPAHMEIPYYHMINETDYEAFTWIEKNIDSYRDENHIYERAAVDPYKACPFSAITRLYIVSSTMHPIPGYRFHTNVTRFLNDGCTDTEFLDEFNVSVVYSNKCVNQNLTMIHPNVYIYSE